MARTSAGSGTATLLGGAATGSIRTVRDAARITTRHIRDWGAAGAVQTKLAGHHRFLRNVAGPEMHRRADARSRRSVTPNRSSYYRARFVTALRAAGRFVAVVRFTAAFLATVRFTALTFFAAVFLAGAFFATVFFATRFAGAFFAGAFLAAVRFAGAFFAATFLVVRLAGAFFAAAFAVLRFAGAFLAAALFAGALFAAAFFRGAVMPCLLVGNRCRTIVISGRCDALQRQYATPSCLLAVVERHFVLHACTT
jgi:hypothetical protein